MLSIGNDNIYTDYPLYLHGLHKPTETETKKLIANFLHVAGRANCM